MSQALFGSGLAVLTPILSSGTPTPIVVGVLQDISVDFSSKVVDLVGSLQFPVDKTKGESKVTGKFKSGYFAGGLIQAILSGATSAVGNNMAVANEQFTLAAGTYTTAKGALTLADLGVFDTITNKFLVAVPSGPTTGQYVPPTAAGVIVMAAADNGHVMQVSYSYSSASVGTTISYTNQPMGTNTTFAFRLFNQYQASTSTANSAPGAGLYLPVVTIPKLSLAFKNSGFMEKSVDFEASANTAGLVATVWTGN